MNLQEAQGQAEALVGGPGKRVLTEEWRGECRVWVTTFAPQFITRRLVSVAPNWPGAIEQLEVSQ